MKTIKFQLILLLIIGTMTVVSCGPSKAEQEAERQRIEAETRARVEQEIKEEQEREQQEAQQREQEAQQREQAELEEQKRQELEAAKKRAEANVWIAPNGTKYDVKKLIKSFYQRGVQLGQHDKTGGTRQIKYFHNNGTEKGFKSEFVYNFGIPSDDKSQKIYNQGLKEYLRGYEDGWNF